jgi:hypothetical protein
MIFLLHLPTPSLFPPLSSFFLGPSYRFYSMVYGVDDKRFEVSPMFGSYYLLINEGGRIKVNDTVLTKKVYEKKQR